MDGLLEWYKVNGRDLPFRNTNDPYKIWISEIMLQQTTVKAVIDYYIRFLEKYPTIFDLCQASLDDVYKIWEGLGYYRRAKYLYESAHIIVDKYNGIFPRDYNDILSLKGVGEYTANAICAFAFHDSRSAIDGNALRVFSRYFCIHDDINKKSTVDMIRRLSDDMIINFDARDYNYAIMDLAQSICTPNSPKCTQCPLNLKCKAYLHHEENILPIKIKKLKKKDIGYITGIITYKDQLLLTRNNTGLLENMYGLIQYEVSDPYEFIEVFKNDFHINIKVISYIKDYKHVFTHRNWYMKVYHFVLEESIDSMYTKDEVYTLAIPTAHKKIIDDFLLHNVQ